MFKKYLHHFTNPILVTLFNAVLVISAIIANTILQTFCIPVNWAIIVLIICFSTTIIFPFLKPINKLRFSIISFINGFSVSVYIYMIVFLDYMNLFGIALIIIGIGLLVFVPHIFCFQIIRRYFYKKELKPFRIYYLMGAFFSLGIFIFSGILYNTASSEIEATNSKNYHLLEKNYINERILGMHFIYHTKFCPYDGWRPPKHDPILVMGMWLNGRNDPIDLHLEERIKLYKKAYPNNPVKFDCSCASDGKKAYDSDIIWLDF